MTEIPFGFSLYWLWNLPYLDDIDDAQISGNLLIA